MKADTQKTPDHLTGLSLFLAAATGFLLFLSFPKYGSDFCAWIAFIPLFFALHSTSSIRQGFVLGLLAGLIFHVGIIYWIVYVVVNYGHLPYYLGIIVMMLLAAYLSLYAGLFAAGIVYLRRKPSLYLLAPLLWVCLEYLKSHLLTGFPWENLGYSQYRNFYFIQIADVIGISGISFMVVLANAAIFNLIRKKTKKELLAASVVLAILAGIYFYGFFRVKQINNALEKAPAVEVALLQGNIDQSMKWNENYQQETINIYEKLSLANKRTKGGLIVWPETAIPFYFQENNKLQRQIKDIPAKTENWLIVGSPSYVIQRRETAFFNSAYIISPAGEITGKYDKVHLVPYGEYVPLREVFPFISKLTAGMGDFASGRGFHTLNMADLPIGLLICYEAILPEAARAYKNNGAALLITITNDAWFGNTSAPYQHFSMAAFRAIETRLYLLRSANTGISGIVSPTGEVVSQTKLFAKAAVNDSVKIIKVPTIYAVIGDIPVIVCFIILLFFVLLDLKGRKSNAVGKYAGSGK